MKRVSDEDLRCLVKGISLPRWMIRVVKEKAKQEGVSFSAYVREALRFFVDQGDWKEGETWTEV